MVALQHFHNANCLWYDSLWKHFLSVTKLALLMKMTECWHTSHLMLLVPSVMENHDEYHTSRSASLRYPSAIRKCSIRVHFRLSEASSDYTPLMHFCSPWEYFMLMKAKPIDIHFQEFCLPFVHSIARYVFPCMNILVLKHYITNFLPVISWFGFHSNISQSSRRYVYVL